ncbi:hypothetical protein Cme02nite_38480 [Catellatospora methionotrophica]|uniref:Uncharacterized protein n=1 Tax=Catellatospora methionotrophica TaxID=121620 RepID=A0A8J3LHZ4_9ACTN|nr:hypothetical protein [Catellatospora methionotrophica]GIG15516.1 hypothetical protein Cme02nite_38480 [Catellatospora methionotrophica]
MPTPGTQRVAIRIEEDLWERFGEAAHPNRSTVLREFIRWYLTEPGTKRPTRPLRDYHDAPDLPE